MKDLGPKYECDKKIIILSLRQYLNKNIIIDQTIIISGQSQFPPLDNKGGKAEKTNKKLCNVAIIYIEENRVIK